MKTPCFFYNTVLALALSLAGSIIVSLLVSTMPIEWAWKYAVSFLSCVYIACLMFLRGQKSGLVTGISFFIVAQLLLWFLPLTVILFTLSHIALVWLYRSIFFYQSILSALLDLALSCFSFLVAIWTLLYTQSPLLSLWCFFLCQAFFAFIPGEWAQCGASNLNNSKTPLQNSTAFSQAQRSAEAALKQLVASS